MLKKWVWVGLISTLLFACNANNTIGSESGDGGDGSGTGSADMSGGGGGGETGDFCVGSGPPVLINSGSGSATQACTGRLAEVAFRYGLCTCQSLFSGSQVTVDSYDSQQGMTPANLGGSVGINGQVSSGSPVSIGGSLFIGDAGGLSFTNVSIGQELRCAGSAVGSNDLTIGSNAFVNGDANVGGNLSVGGTLTLPAGKIVGGKTVPTRVVRAPVSVPPPCDCSPETRIDVAGYISQYQKQNDNASIFLDPDRLKNYNGNTTLELPCGRYYLSGINGSGTLNLQVNGRVALFIGGDMQLASTFTITIARGGSLDLFIGGQFNAGSTLNLGTPQTAAQLRIYMGSDAAVNMPANSTLAGELYAPLSSLNCGANLTVYGALFVRQVAISGVLTIHHDTAIFRAGTGCPMPSKGCTSCRDCGNQACSSGTCGGCTDNSQCCSPAVCVRGQCTFSVG